jgi:chromosome segregation ATPase
MEFPKKVQIECDTLASQCQKIEKELKELPTNFRLADQYVAIEYELENIQDMNEKLKDIVCAYNRERSNIEKRIMRTQLNISILEKRIEKYKNSMN